MKFAHRATDIRKSDQSRCRRHDMKRNFKLAAALVLTLGIGAQVSQAGLRPDDPPTPPPIGVSPEPPIIDEPPVIPPVVTPPPVCNTPEPGTMVLALSAAGIAGAYTRRKRKQAS
jgi:hypothetical protein